MRELLYLVGVAAIATVIGAATPAGAQPYGPGMMGGYGMMHGYGYGPGMMYGPDGVTEITILATAAIATTVRAVVGIGTHHRHYGRYGHHCCGW